MIKTHAIKYSPLTISTSQGGIIVAKSGGRLEMDVIKKRRNIIFDSILGWFFRIEALIIIPLLIIGEFVLGYTIPANYLLYALIISLFSLWLSRLFFNIAKRLKVEVFNAKPK